MRLTFKNINTSKNFTIKITVVSIAVLLYIIGKQGFDVVDEGWYLSFYQQFFNNPSTVEYNFVYYITGIIGGVWYELFPYGGIFSFRVLAILCMLCTFVLCYAILKKYLPKLYIITALLMVLFINDFGYVAFYYNHLSSFFAVLTIYFLLKGLTKNNQIFILLAGFVTAVNVFSRLPNVTLFAFSLIFPCQLLWEKFDKKLYWFKQLTSYSIGAALGLIFIGFILFAFGHLEIMKNAITNLFLKGKNTESNHNLSRLALVYINDYGLVLKAFFKICGSVAILMLTKNILYKNRYTKIGWFLLGTLLFIIVFRVHSIFSLYAFSMFGCISLLIIKQIEYKIKALSFLALIMALFLPLGSDGGITNAGYVCVWLSFPLFFYAINLLNSRLHLKKNDFILLNLITEKQFVKNTLWVLILGFFILKTYKIFNNSYFDYGNRLQKTYAINHPLANVYTTQRRARIINDLLPNLKNYVSKGDFLLAYDKIPMINFITETKPYMYNSWVWVYDGVLFEKQLKRAEKEIKDLPIVLQQKFETIVNFSEPDSSYMSQHKENDYFYDKARVITMNSFLKKHKYQIVWSNAYFNVYKSFESKK